jgi:hypothetical protein
MPFRATEKHAMKTSREEFVTTRRVLLALPFLLGLAGPAGAQTEVKVGLIAPLSGPWARQGDLLL